MDRINKKDTNIKANRVLLIKRKKQDFNYFIVTKAHVFLYKEKLIRSKTDEKLLKKIIPLIEEEFYCL